LERGSFSVVVPLSSVFVSCALTLDTLLFLCRF